MSKPATRYKLWLGGQAFDVFDDLDQAREAAVDLVHEHMCKALELGWKDCCEQNETVEVEIHDTHLDRLEETCTVMATLIWRFECELVDIYKPDEARP